MKVALVYDRVNKWGGAERVLLALHEIFPDAFLCTSVYNSESAPWAKVFPKIIPSFLQNIPLAKDRHEHFPYLMPVAFESFNFDEYDLVISVTSEAAKGIITKLKTFHLCYCLTPTRYLWSGYGDYFRSSSFKRLVNPVVSYLRSWDLVASQRPDAMVAISWAVKERIKKYYGRDSDVIYPPVDTGAFQNISSLSRVSREFYLIVSRLVPYKKVDLAVNAFNFLGLPLLIAGVGSEEKKLKGMAKPNIKFLGQLTDGELAGYYENCVALIHPQEEDFGIAAVEAQAFGSPVIAYKGGGAKETVIEGKTGLFFGEQKTESLIDAVKRFKKLRNLRKEDLMEQANKFSKDRFKKEFLKMVEKYMGESI